MIKTQFSFTEEQLKRLYDLAPKWLAMKNISYPKSRAAPFLLRWILNDGLAVIEKEMREIERENGKKEETIK